MYMLLSLPFPLFSLTITPRTPLLSPGSHFTPATYSTATYHRHSPKQRQSLSGFTARCAFRKPTVMIPQALDMVASANFLRADCVRHICTRGQTHEHKVGYFRCVSGRVKKYVKPNVNLIGDASQLFFIEHRTTSFVMHKAKEAHAYEDAWARLLWTPLLCDSAAATFSHNHDPSSR